VEIEIVEGDITAQQVDVVVNAANTSLLGGGVDGAIHRRGGPEILAECRKLRAGHYGRGLQVGQAVATTAVRPPARWVVHTVGPVWSADEDRSALLTACHRNSLQVAVAARVRGEDRSRRRARTRRLGAHGALRPVRGRGAPRVRRRVQQAVNRFFGHVETALVLKTVKRAGAPA
jgi:hypothetical protein